MPASETEQMLQAIEALLGAVTDAEVERNSAVPEKIPAGGLIMLRDGDPGEPEQALGGFATAYYRHDAYGTARGLLSAGESHVARLEIEHARHQPTPLFGTPRCAGFRDIDSFRDYAVRGDRIIDFVRWHD